MEYPEWMGEGGANVPEDLRDNPALLDTPDIGTLAKRFLDNHAAIGRSVRIPGEDATETVMQAFHKELMEKVPGLMPTPDMTDEETAKQFYLKMGMPEEKTGYETPEIDLKGMELPDSLIQGFQDLAHGAGLSQKQFQQIVKNVAESNIETALLAQEQQKEAMTALQSEWGTNFEPRLTGILNMVKKTEAPEQLINAVQNKLLDVATLKWLYSVKKLFGSEGSELVNQDTPQETGLDAAEAQSRADEIFKKLQDMTPSDPQYQRLLKKRVELIKIATGNKE